MEDIGFNTDYYMYNLLHHSVGSWDLRVLVLQLNFIGGSHILLSPLSNGGGLEFILRDLFLFSLFLVSLSWSLGGPALPIK